jgi:DHA1 family multidrug resistance protein-like MFS transporter
MRAMYSVVILAISTFMVNVGASIMIPFLPVYAKSFGATLGIEIGLFTSMFLLTRIFMNYYSGKQSDRLGRKRLIVIGIVICALSSLLFAIPVNWYVILCVRALQGVGSAMVWVPSTALLGDLMPKGKRGFAMGVYTSLSMAGWVLGPGIGGAAQGYFRTVSLLSLQGSFQAVFFTFALLQAATLVLVLIFIREPRIEQGAKAEMGVSLTMDVKLKRSLLVMSLLVFSFAFIVALIEPLLVYHAQLAFGLSADEVILSMTVVYLVAGGLVIGAQLIAGLLADRFSKKVIIAVSAFAAQALAFLMPFAANVANIGLLIVLWYGFFSLATPAYLALLQDLFPQRLRGTLTGAFLTIFDLGSLVGPILGFLVYDNISAALPFIMSGVLGILTVVAFFAYVREPGREIRSAKDRLS